MAKRTEIKRFDIDKAYNVRYPRKCLVCDGEGKLLYPPKVIGARGPGDKIVEHPLAGTLKCVWCNGKGEMKD